MTAPFSQTQTLAYKLAVLLDRSNSSMQLTSMALDALPNNTDVDTAKALLTGLYDVQTADNYSLQKLLEVEDKKQDNQDGAL